jgi:hypothetical protein
MSYESKTGLGVQAHYGPRDAETKFGGKVPGENVGKKLILTFDFDDLPADAAEAGISAQLPANCSILSAKMEIITGFTSTSTTTDLDVGVTDADGGSNITDPNGLITVAEATQATIATAGNIITGAGAMVGATIGAEAGVVTVVPNVDDLLTGKARIVVEYLPQGV